MGGVGTENLSAVLQLSINYDGRKSEGVNAVHTANVQVRAYFLKMSEPGFN